MNARRPYVRTMDGWWKRDPFFVRYMYREFTAVFVAAYAIVLLVGLIRLSHGEAAWTGWLEAMKSPIALIFHLVVLGVFLYHTWSWFKIMPKTMAAIYRHGQKVPPETITLG